MTSLISRVFARIFSKKLRQWRDSMIADGKLFGSPVKDDAKLWRSIWPEIKIWLTELVHLIVGKTMKTKVQISVRKTNLVKISKKFLLITRDDSLAKKAAEACIKSGKQYGEYHDLEVLTIEKNLNVSDFFKRNNLTWSERESEFFSFPSDLKDFCLHFRAWLNCAKTGEPVLIMQQGTMFRSPVPALRFKDVIVFGTNSSILTISSKKSEIFYPKYSLIDAYCYAITPLGARKLIEVSQRKIIGTVHKFICKRYVNIIYCTERSHPVNFTSALAQPHDIVKPQDATWKSYSTDD